MRIDLSKIKLQLKVVKHTKKVVPKEIPPKKLTKLINGKVLLKDGIYSCVISYDEFANRMFGNIDVKEITDNAQSIEIPFTVESFTIHTITPPSQTTLYNSFAIFSKSNEYPLYVLRPSYGGDVTTKSTLSSSRSLKPCKQSIL